MSAFELSRHITIGQYVPTNSVIHRMDPRFKIVAFIIFVLAVTASPSILANLVLLGIGLALLRIARIPLSYGLSTVVPAIPVLVIFFVLQMFLYQPSGVSHFWFDYGFLRLSWPSVSLAVVSLLRFVEIVAFISAFTLATELPELTHGLEQLLRPLRVVRFPVHEISLVATIALRFVPTFAEEADKLMKAQASRGAGFGTMRWWQVVRRIRSVYPIILPLFLIAMERADELAVAMEARGYVAGAPRTSYVELVGSLRDYLYLAVSLAVCGLILYMRWPW